MASRALSHSPRTLTANKASKSSTGMASSVPILSKPAEQTRPLRRPKRRPIAWKTVATLCADATSHSSVWSRSPPDNNSWRNASSPAVSRSSARTVQPSPRRRLAVPRPMPEAAPVIAATLLMPAFPNSQSSRSRRQDHALARALGIEQAIGLLGLVEPPLVREQLLHVNVVVGHELRALGLALRREGP